MKLIQSVIDSEDNKKSTNNQICLLTHPIIWVLGRKKLQVGGGWGGELLEKFFCKMLRFKPIFEYIPTGKK